MTIWWYCPAESYCIDDCIDKYIKHCYTQASALQHTVFTKVNSKSHKQSVAYIKTCFRPKWPRDWHIATKVLCPCVLSQIYPALLPPPPFCYNCLHLAPTKNKLVTAKMPNLWIQTVVGDVTVAIKKSSLCPPITLYWLVESQAKNKLWKAKVLIASNKSLNVSLYV